MLIEEMTMTDFSNFLQVTRTVLIPFGSTEEHGTHLPLSTDTIQAYEVCKKVANILPIFIAPPIHYGNCRSTSQHPGTISISTSTLRGLMIDIVTSFRSQGILNFIVLTGHAGGAHKMALQDAGEELISKFSDIKIAVLVEYELVVKEASNIYETIGDSHAGEIETSRILNYRPDLVKGDAEKFFPNFPYGILVNDKLKYWPSGIWGDPSKATCYKGSLIEEAVVNAVINVIRQQDDTNFT
jgi:creatinine amidohydrolase